MANSVSQNKDSDQLSAIGDSLSAIGYRLCATGVVQGVGFRPFVYGLATRLDLKGWVCNTSSGVVIEIEGCPEGIDEFRLALTRDAPPLARIDQLAVEPLPLNHFTRFEIRESASQVGAFQPISPDISICPDCLRELFDPKDRRYLYPFINCTNCGPRFTIIKDIPYDRPKTTMASFEMCDDCSREYHDPLNRRFHAQPIACPKCGPKITLEFNRTSTPSGVPSKARNKVEGRGERALSASFDFAANTTPLRSGRLREESQSAIEEAQRLLSEGKIIAVKGLGGFHLACDATDENAVAELRRRKGRIDKPFALMMPDVETVERYCHVSSEERALLESHERPVVLLQKRDAASPAIADSVAPRQHTLGVMLPYTPLHYLLLHPSSLILHPLVMTSGNFSEEPIATRNDDALTRLAPLADAFLLHDRDIHTRVDDSVVRVIATDSISNPHASRPITNNQLLFLRRSRGYAPYPVKLPFNVPPLLAVGGELKNTFCVARDHYAFLSHHIGDMENLETLKSFEDGVTHFQNLFRINPEIIAHDLHPDYLSTRYAIRNTQYATRIAVQHHHAHIASCMAENNHKGDRSVIGVAFDGTGYGIDGAIWGGEFLIANYKSFNRVAHLAYIPLPGGDAATRKPARVALSHLLAANIYDHDLPPFSALSLTEQRIITKQITSGLNSPFTSSMGRLFDAVASIIGVRQEVNYEGQAAIELEAIADADETGIYNFEVAQEVILPYEAIRSVVNDFRARVPTPIIAARFHNGVATMIRDMCLRLREQYALNQVALSGGVFQNVTLLSKTVTLLRGAEFEVLTHHLVPPNDGGIALGQAVIANYQ